MALKNSITKRASQTPKKLAKRKSKIYIWLYNNAMGLKLLSKVDDTEASRPKSLYIRRLSYYFVHTSAKYYSGISFFWGGLNLIQEIPIS